MALNIILQPLTSAFSGLLDAHPKDAIRLARNAAAYAAAVAGDDNALNFLKFMSGKFGSGIIQANPLYSPGGGPASGWATAKAQGDAYAKYQQALASRQAVAGGLLGTGVAVGSGSQGQTTGQAVGTILGKVSLWVWVALAFLLWWVLLRGR